MSTELFDNCFGGIFFNRVSNCYRNCLIFTMNTIICETAMNDMSYILPLSWVHTVYGTLIFKICISTIFWLFSFVFHRPCDLLESFNRYSLLFTIKVNHKCFATCSSLCMLTYKFWLLRKYISEFIVKLQNDLYKNTF